MNSPDTYNIVEIKCMYSSDSARLFVDRTDYDQLREQVEKLIASEAYWKADSAAAWDKSEERRLENEKLRAFLENTGEHSPYCDVFTLDDEGRHKDCTCGLTEALSLPDLFTPVLNKYRAEGMRMAQHTAWDMHKRGGRESVTAFQVHEAIRAQAAELEKQT